MKYRFMSGWVTVTGPPLAICRLNNGTTLPRLPRTFPKRTTVNERPVLRAASKTIISASLFVAPITFTGRIALSVEIRTKRDTPFATQTSTTFRVPWILFITASLIFISIKWNMFMRSSMKYNIRSMLFENIFQSAIIADISNNRVNWQGRIIFLQFDEGFKDAIFTMSKQDQFKGFQRAICRHNSRPIDPPAPVTRTDLPQITSPINSSLIRVGSLRRRSVMSTSLNFVTDTLPPINS